MIRPLKVTKRLYLKCLNYFVINLWNYENLHFIKKLNKIFKRFIVL